MKDVMEDGWNLIEEAMTKVIAQDKAPMTLLDWNFLMLITECGWELGVLAFEDGYDWESGCRPDDAIYGEA